MSDPLIPVRILDRLRQRLELAFGGGAGEVLAVQAPGRTELAGNHTDHEGGQVIAAAVNRHVYGLARPNRLGQIRLESEGYAPVAIDCDDLGRRTSEEGTTAALVRGLAAAVGDAAGGARRGFDLVVVSEVPAGSGLSSSAAFELAVAQAMNLLWAGGAIHPLRLARLAQQAENRYFGKPCGMMDQAAIACGGIVRMDFNDPRSPQVERLSCDFSHLGYTLCLVAVGADHAANTSDYAAVPAEMQAVARELGRTRLRDVDENEVLGALPELRRRLGDRAALRSLHYFREERLVERRVEALRTGDMDAFLAGERLSGTSSAMYLQNVSVPGASSQPAMVALAVAQELLGGRGAARIHGGGFGGTIQAFVPSGEAEAFCRRMDAALGRPGAAALYQIEREGASAQWL